MRGSLLALLLVAFCTHSASGDDAAARAKAALELAKAKALVAKEKAKEKAKQDQTKGEQLPAPREVFDMSQAKEKAKTTGKPMFVSTCENCVQTCTELSKLGPVVHVPPAKDQAIFRVQVWDGESNWYYHDWDKLPGVAEVEAKVKELQFWVKKPPAKLQDTKPDAFRISLPSVDPNCVGNT